MPGAATPTARSKASHYRYAIRTFWWGLFWLVVAILLKVVLIGFVVLGLLWLWSCGGPAWGGWPCSTTVPIG